MKLNKFYEMTALLDQVKEELRCWNNDFEVEVETFENTLYVSLPDGYSFELNRLAEVLNGRVVDRKVCFDL